MTLLNAAPNLVLDGLQLAAEAVGARQAYLYLHRGTGSAVQVALAERSAAGLDRLAVTVTESPARFLAGQETAVVNWLGGGPAIPVFTPPRVTERGLDGHRTLVQNVETLAHLALIARYGPGWFRSIGTPAQPGSMLVTRYPASGGCQIAEVEIGTPLAGILGPDQEAQAWLVGGYHGTWLRVDGRLTLDDHSLRAPGASPGAGVLAALPADRCGVRETARVAGYLAAESAGQCGPCLNGLPRIAAALAELAGTRPGRSARADIERWAALVQPARCLRPPRWDGALCAQRAPALRTGDPRPRARPLHRREPPALPAATTGRTDQRGALDLTAILPLLSQAWKPGGSRP